MDNSTLKIQVQSFGNYLRDMWIVALTSLLIYNQTTIALPFIWIGLQLIIAIASLIIFRKTGPNLVVPFIVPSLILLFLFLFGSPIWLFVLGTIISIWRIQARFNMVQHEQNIDSFFMLIFFFTFLLIHFSSFILGYEGYHYILYTVFVTGIALFVGIRLFSILMSMDKHIAVKKSKILGIYVMFIVSVASLSVFIYFIARIIRDMIEVLFVAITSIVIIPFAPLIEYLEKLMKKLEYKKVEESTDVPIGEQPEIEPEEVLKEGISEGFPFEWILFGLGTIVVIFLIRYLIKNKPEKLEVEQSNFQYEQSQISEEEEKQKRKSNSLYKVETSILREKYVQFEVEAKTFKLERNKSETVREWFKRMDWTVNHEFFNIYEEVRYGKQMIESKKAELFIETLDETKSKYFIEKDV